MPTARRVAVIVGSIRRDSYNLKLAKALIALAPDSLQFEILGIGALPLYNPDLESAPPDAWTSFRQSIRDTEAVLFVTPEHNRSIPAALKNAVDIGSRPPGHGVWSGKPAGVMSLTPGGFGAMASNLHLRQVLGANNVACMPGETYLAGAADLFDAEGALINEKTREFLQKFTAGFLAWIGKIAPR